MADITMPRLSDTMEEGTIATWLKKPGEQIGKGEVIAQIETDKATMDLTAFEAGTLQEILAPEGTTVAIGQPVARLGNGKPPAKAEVSAEPEAVSKRPPPTSAPPRQARPPSRRPTARQTAKCARRRWLVTSPPNTASSCHAFAAAARKVA
jgi:pyruvate dehydrogenase E2 component (dihydrolipoamide acetyltransferase)